MPAVRVLIDREVKMAKLMAKGMSNDDIAREAFVSLGTVKTHVSNIPAKLYLQSRIQIVVWAFETVWRPRPDNAETWRPPGEATSQGTFATLPPWGTHDAIALSLQGGFSCFGVDPISERHFASFVV
jgi:DNA-binding CsgD family transcriptional regulator